MKMIIDTDWIEEKIRKNKEILQSYYEVDEDYPEALKETGIALCEAFIEAYETVKKELQLPKELIAEAFRRGQSSAYLINRGTGERIEYEITVEEYLKQNNYV